MRLFEYQAKNLLSSQGIPVPRGFVVTSAKEVEEAVKELGVPVILKSQVLAGGRGKAGAIKKASSAIEALMIFKELMARPVQGEVPTLVLVEEFKEHVSEMYLSATLNRSERRFVLIIAAKGGVDVDSIGEKATIHLSDNMVNRASVVEAGAKLGIAENSAHTLATIAEKICDLSAKIEAELVEINPIVITANGKALALDAKIVVDDNALFRHPDIAALRTPTGLEAESQEGGFNFVGLDGDIAVIGNGAGLVLSTLDLLVEKGGKPACFLDLGGGASEDVVLAALRVISKLDRVRGILLNIFGGITRTPDVASAILQAYSSGLIKVPLHARILGAGEEEASAILRGLPISLHRDIEDVVRNSIEDAQRIQ